MDVILHEAGSALYILFSPLRVGLLLAGVLFGLTIGVIPGLGGIVALSLLLPFTFGMDPYSAMAILIGVLAAVSHGDVIPAVLFGVPGTVGCAATVMDGHPMAKRGEAGRALGAAFSASLFGGLFGAILLGITVPLVRPIVLFFGTPELLAILIFGLTLAASLSGNAPLKGMLAASVGLLMSFVGEDMQTGTLRFTFESLYLWNGIAIVPLALGIFAVPELCEIAINRTSISSERRADARRGQWQGCRDSLKHWFLVARTGMLGAACGMVPGLGAAVIDWIAYGHAIKTEKGASQTFGRGDVRGVIAAESSTNSREGGSLVTTIAFGVPGQPSMAIMLGAFLIQGIVPGPSMLTTHLDLTYTIVWSLALANVFGTIICFAFANQFARLATIPYGILVPVVTILVFMGSLEGKHSWGDIVVLLSLGAISWVMKRCGWPRPPLVLGFVLGELIERNLFISFERYGWSWLSNWFVLSVLIVAAVGLLQQIIAKSKIASFRATRLRMPRVSLHSIFALLVFLLFTSSLVIVSGWPFDARLAPQVVSGFGAAVGALVLFMEAFGRLDAAPLSQPAMAMSGVHGTAMDSQMDYGALSDRVIYARLLEFFLWLFGVLAAGYLIGALPALVIFTFLFPRIRGGQKWGVTLAVSGATLAFLWGVFDFIAHTTWPPSVLGDMFPALRSAFAWF